MKHSPSVLRLLILSLVVLFFSFGQAFAQPLFKVYPSKETPVEGPPVDVLVIKTDNDLRFVLRVPDDYGAQVRQGDESIIFTSHDGASVITLKMTTNYAGKLPKKEALHDEVVKKFPAASVGPAANCITACGAGLMFDLFQPTSKNLTMHIRDAYVPYAEGSFEFTLSCDAKEYDKHRLSYMWLLNSFRAQAEPAKKNP